MHLLTEVAAALVCLYVLLSTFYVFSYRGIGRIALRRHAQRYFLLLPSTFVIYFPTYTGSGRGALCRRAQRRGAHSVCV